MKYKTLTGDCYANYHLHSRWDAMRRKCDPNGLYTELFTTTTTPEPSHYDTADSDSGAASQLRRVESLMLLAALTVLTLVSGGFVI